MKMVTESNTTQANFLSSLNGMNTIRDVAIQNTGSMLEDFIKTVGYINSITDMNNKSYSLETDRQKEILTELFNNVYYDNKFFLILDIKYNFQKLIEKDAIFKLKNITYPESVQKISIMNGHRKETKEFELVNITRAIQVLKSMNQIDDFTYDIDLYADQTRIIRIGSSIKIIKNYFSFIMPEQIKNEDLNMAIQCLEHYEKHFPLFNEFPEMIVAPVFTKDRKTSWNYLRVCSNWGKSLLFESLAEMKMSVKVEYSKLSNERGDASPEELLNALVTYQDEIRFIPGDIKDMTNTFRVSPKGRMGITVPCFSKFLLSAELSESLQNGVDKQLKNRITKLDFTDITTPITEEQIYIDNSYVYKLAIQNYYYYKIVNLIEEYKAMGAGSATNRANGFLASVHKKYKIGDSEDLLAVIQEYAQERIIEIVKKAETKPFSMGSGKLEVCKKDYVIYHKIYEKYITAVWDEEKQYTKIYIRHGKDFYIELMKEIPNIDKQKKYMYKANEWEKLLGGVNKNAIHPIYGIKCRFLEIIMK